MSSLPASYEFSEADAACALQAIDSWVDGAAHGAQHISPEKVSKNSLGCVRPQHVQCCRHDHVARRVVTGLLVEYLVVVRYTGEVAVERVRQLTRCSN